MYLGERYRFAVQFALTSLLNCAMISMHSSSTPSKGLRSTTLPPRATLLLTQKRLNHRINPAERKLEKDVQTLNNEIQNRRSKMTGFSDEFTEKILNELLHSTLASFSLRVVSSWSRSSLYKILSKLLTALLSSCTIGLYRSITKYHGLFLIWQTLSC